MNVQILPNWFKKIALLLFAISFIIVGLDDFLDGFHGARNNTEYNMPIENIGSHLMRDLVGGEKGMYIFKIISLVSILVYMVSKEKVEDDYIKTLRLESFQLSFLIIILVGILFILFDINELYGLFDSLTLFLWLYLIIFFIKKRKY